MVQSKNHGGRRHGRNGRVEEPAHGATDRLPPHSVEGERAVLSCCLQAPRESIAECVTRFGPAGSEVFYDLRYRMVYEVMTALQEKGEPIEPILVLEGLKGRTETQGWEAVPGFISELMDAAPSAANLEWYLKTVWEKHLLRSMLRALGEGAQRIYGDGSLGDGPQGTAGPTVAEVLDGIEASVLGVNEGTGQAEASAMRELTLETNELIDRMRRGVGLMGGIRTHFGYFDKMTGGLHRKELAVLAARPSTGKTSWMLNMAVNVAKREQVPVAIFSMEMSKADLMLRMRCSDAGVNFHKLRTGFASREDLEQLAERSVAMSRLPIYIDDSRALGILEIRARARRMAQRYGCRWFAADYLQLAHGIAGRDYRGNREREVADISAGFKAMAHELDAPLLVLSQLNREVERAKNRKPQLADLRESGAIENDADLVAMLYKPKGTKEEEEDEEADVIRVNALIAKQRNGPTGDCEMLFTKSLMLMADAYENRSKFDFPSGTEGERQGDQWRGAAEQGGTGNLTQRRREITTKPNPKKERNI